MSPTIQQLFSLRLTVSISLAIFSWAGFERTSFRLGRFLLDFGNTLLMQVLGVLLLMIRVLSLPFGFQMLPYFNRLPFHCPAL
jgi:hypothetical protein